MTLAWDGHLKFRNVALWKVVLVSWGITFFEYCFQVPANRIGSYEFSAAQLKPIQEVITLSVFFVFSVVHLGESLKWNYLVGFGFISLAVFFIFHRWRARPVAAATQRRPACAKNVVTLASAR